MGQVVIYSALTRAGVEVDGHPPAHSIDVNEKWWWWCTHLWRCCVRHQRLIATTEHVNRRIGALERTGNARTHTHTAK